MFDVLPTLLYISEIALPRGCLGLERVVGHRETPHCRGPLRRAPIPIAVLTELAEHYLTERQGTLLRPEPLAEALAWATAISHGTSSLLLPTDYLIDLPGLNTISQATWDTLIERATPEQALDIGQAATDRDQHAVVRQCARSGGKIVRTACGRSKSCTGS